MAYRKKVVTEWRINMLQEFKTHLVFNKRGTKFTYTMGYTGQTANGKNLTARLKPAFQTINGKRKWQLLVQFTEGTQFKKHLFSPLNGYLVLATGDGMMSSKKLGGIAKYETQMKDLLQAFIDSGATEWKNPMTEQENFALLA
jgi:hypothetical protein